jgi:hypothetical protein
VKAVESHRIDSFFGSKKKKKAPVVVVVVMVAQSEYFHGST